MCFTTPGQETWLYSPSHLFKVAWLILEPEWPYSQLHHFGDFLLETLVLAASGVPMQLSWSPGCSNDCISIKFYLQLLCCMSVYPLWDRVVSSAACCAALVVSQGRMWCVLLPASLMDHSRAKKSSECIWAGRGSG